MTYLLRFLSALCLFAVLARANVFLDVYSNTILVLGYRALLIFSPFALRWLGRSAAGACFVAAAGGLVLFLLPGSSAHIVAALAVGLGLSIGGYVLKATASESATGASWNKIALNAGSLVAGLYVALVDQSFGLPAFLVPLAVILLASGVISVWRNRLERRIAKDQKPRVTLRANKRQRLGWGFIGIAIGIKLFGVFAILPQYLIQTNAEIPAWYGYLVSLNAIIVIGLQRPIMFWITQIGPPSKRVAIVLGALGGGMIILATPAWFFVQSIGGAIVWTILCSIVECFASYLDVAAAFRGCLLPKEAAAGIGAAACVFFSRFGGDIGPQLTGGLGFICIIIGTILLYVDSRVRQKAVSVNSEADKTLLRSTKSSDYNLLSAATSPRPFFPFLVAFRGLPD